MDFGNFIQIIVLLLLLLLLLLLSSKKGFVSFFFYFVITNFKYTLLSFWHYMISDLMSTLFVFRNQGIKPKWFSCAELSSSGQQTNPVEKMSSRYKNTEIVHKATVNRVPRGSGIQIFSHCSGFLFQIFQAGCGTLQNFAFSKQKTRCRCLETLKWWKINYKKYILSRYFWVWALHK